MLMHLCAHKDRLYYWRSVVSGRSTYQTDEFRLFGAWRLVLSLKKEQKSFPPVNPYLQIVLNQISVPVSFLFRIRQYLVRQFPEQKRFLLPVLGCSSLMPQKTHRLFCSHQTAWFRLTRPAFPARPCVLQYCCTWFSSRFSVLPITWYPMPWIRILKIFAFWVSVIRSPPSFYRCCSGTAKRRSFVHFWYPHGLRQVKNCIMRKTVKKRLFYIIFGEKTSFFAHFINETNGGFQAAAHQTPSLENCETTAFLQCSIT